MKPTIFEIENVVECEYFYTSQGVHKPVYIKTISNDEKKNNGHYLIYFK